MELTIEYDDEGSPAVGSKSGSNFASLPKPRQIRFDLTNTD